MAAFEDLESEPKHVSKPLPEEEIVPDQETASRVLLQAIADNKRVHLRYYSYHRDEQNERDVDPWAIMAHHSAKYLVGYCYLRQEERTFRLDRILAMRVLPYAISRPRPAAWDQHGWRSKMDELTAAYQTGKGTPESDRKPTIPVPKRIEPLQHSGCLLPMTMSLLLVGGVLVLTLF